MNSQSAAHPSQVVCAFWEAQERGDRETARSLLCDSLVWRVAGDHSEVARTYEGVDSFFQDLIGALGQVFVPGSVRLELTGIYTDEARDTVISHVHETVKARNGLDFDIEIVTIMHVVDGRISTCEEFMDLHEVRRVFER